MSYEKKVSMQKCNETCPICIAKEMLPENFRAELPLRKALRRFLRPAKIIKTVQTESHMMMGKAFLVFVTFIGTEETEITRIQIKAIS